MKVVKSEEKPLFIGLFEEKSNLYNMGLY